MASLLSCLFNCCLLWSRTDRNGGASVGGVAACVLRATERPAVVQSAQERPLPLWWCSVDHGARGWDLHINRHEKLFFSSLIEHWWNSHLSIYTDHKRLDYVLEHQVLATSSETHDVEVFINFTNDKWQFTDSWVGNHCCLFSFGRSFVLCSSAVTISLGYTPKFEGYITFAIACIAFIAFKLLWGKSVYQLNVMRCKILSWLQLIFFSLAITLLVYLIFEFSLLYLFFSIQYGCLQSLIF